VSKACRKLGISRQHYHDIRKAIEEEGLEGLFDLPDCLARIRFVISRSGLNSPLPGACDIRGYGFYYSFFLRSVTGSASLLISSQSFLWSYYI